ncbi:MAG: acyltransferase family protein [Candidatus Omnitrophota bacterium]
MHLLWMDLARALAVLGVIVIHASADVITEWGGVPDSWWWAANLFDSLARGCVPIFVMISGALLLPVSEGCRDFFRKRANRILLPFVAWTLFYLVWKKLFSQPDLGWVEALRQAAGNGVYYHLWFLYLILGLYLLTPVFRILVAHCSRRNLLYFLGLWFVVASALPCLEKLIALLTHQTFHIAIPIEPAQGFIGYFVLGYFLHQYVTEGAARKALVAWPAALALCTGGTYFLTRHCRSFQGVLYDSMAPNVVIYAASFLVLAKCSGPFLELRVSPYAKKLIHRVSAASFGIYLVHPVFLETLSSGRLGFTLTSRMFHPAWTIPLTAAAVFLLSLISIRILQKIPYLKRIV